LEQLSRAKSVFIPGHLLSNFTRLYGGYVNATTLVTGNSDENFTSLPNLPESVQVWIGQNIAIDSNSVGKIRLHTLPIGLENLAS
jgi:hypothetical protein